VTLPGNLLTENQEGLEADTTGWETGSGEFARDTTRARSGIASLRITSVSSGDTWCYSTGYAAPISPGAVYTVYTWVYTTHSGITARLGFDWLDSGTAYISSAQSPGVVLTPNRWEQVIATFTAPAGAAMAALYLPWFIATAAGQTCWFDDMYFGIPPVAAPLIGWGIPVYS